MKIDTAKIRDVSTSISLIIIPIVLLLVGSELTTKRETQGKIVELAVNILEKEPNLENKSLREWATRVIERYSEVAFTKNERKTVVEDMPIIEPKVSRRTESVVKGVLKPGESSSHVLNLVEGKVLVLKPKEQENDSLYFDIAIKSIANDSICRINRWKGSSGTLGNGIAFLVSNTGDHEVVVTSRDATLGAYEILFHYSDEDIPAKCTQLSHLKLN